MTPFTYLLRWSKYNMSYYGVRYSKKCNPNDLWINYFSSSKYVKQFRNLYGEPDIIEVRKIFSCKENAVKWEQKVLKRLKVPFNPLFLNKNVGGCWGAIDHSSRDLSNNNFINNNPMNSTESRQQLSKTRIEKGLGHKSSKYLPKLYGDKNPMRNPQVIENYKKRIAGRKRQYKEDGSWTWQYPKTNRD